MQAQKQFCIGNFAAWEEAASQKLGVCYKTMLVNIQHLALVALMELFDC